MDMNYFKLNNNKKKNYFELMAPPIYGIVLSSSNPTFAEDELIEIVSVSGGNYNIVQSNKAINHEGTLPTNSVNVGTFQSPTANYAATSEDGESLSNV